MDTTPTNVSKKRNTGRKMRQLWERLHLEQAALRIIQKRITPPNPDSQIAHCLTALDREIQNLAKKRKNKGEVGVYIEQGRYSVAFFLKYPAYIPLMKTEMALRYQARCNKEDMRYHNLGNSVLRAHAEECAGTIHPSGISEWNNNYLHVRNNYIETMGRACMAAEKALYEFTCYQRESAARTQPQPKPNPQPIPQPTPVPSNPTQPVSQNYAASEDTSFDDIEMYQAELQAAAQRRQAAQKRQATLIDKQIWAEQERVAQLLRNRCNDDFNEEETSQPQSQVSPVRSHKPQKITSQKKPIQPDLPSVDRTHS